MKSTRMSRLPRRKEYRRFLQKKRALQQFGEVRIGRRLLPSFGVDGAKTLQAVYAQMFLRDGVLREIRQLVVQETWPMYESRHRAIWHSRGFSVSKMLEVIHHKMSQEKR